MDSFVPILKRILDDGRSYVPSFLLLAGIGFLMIPLDFYVLLLSRKIIDKGFIVQDWETIKYTLIIMIILFLIRSVIRYGTSIFSTKLELRINQKFQNDLFSHILYLPMRFFSKEPTGQLMSRLLEDATRFSMIFNLLFGQGLLRDPCR